MSILPIAVAVFLCATLGGFLLVRGSIIFWGRYQNTFTEQARFNLSDMFMFMDPGNLFRFNAIAIAVVPLLLWMFTGNPLLAVVALVLILVLPKKIYRWMRQRCEFRQQMPSQPSRWAPRFEMTCRPRAFG